jgi:periplasmic copper chaperone A
MLTRSISMMAAWLTIAPAWACELKVDAAWIREAPPSATVLAGYAKFTNLSDRPIRIQSIQSDVFAMIEAHETLVENGVSKMRELTTLEVPAKGAVEFTPNGKHLMLMNPNRMLKKGDVVKFAIKDAGNCVTTADFAVGAEPPIRQATVHEHSQEH